MTVGSGKFQLYASIDPPLEAGDWRMLVNQNLTAEFSSGSNSDDLRVDEAAINFRIRSPRFVMPPDQVLSTFPPANSFGSYGSRLPQIVIKRRTLPWERILTGAPATTPWLALVLIAEGEAKLETGVDVANCVTAGVTLDGVAEVEKGNCLVIRKSMIDKIFPTREDLGLLAHAREVDIYDTELMMGDDDGFLAVVISNRLPLPAKDENGDDVPIKYLACLVNLEGQFTTLLEKSPDPDPVLTTTFPLHEYQYVASAVTDDHHVMGTASTKDRMLNLAIADGGPAPLAAAATGSIATGIKSGVAANAGTKPGTLNGQWSSKSLGQMTSTDISLQMAQSFRTVRQPGKVFIDPEYRYPVLLHWSFTTTGATTFRSLMEGVDSRLLGDVGDDPTDITGRLPLEVVESGHVGLAHKTRDGDDVRSWYRGPLVPHPTSSVASDRLPLAHSSDQLRIVIPDGREDLSLATAFEIGRLLTLSQPAMIASLMRWRQGHYYAARAASMIEANREFWEDVLGTGFALGDVFKLGPKVGRFFVDSIVKNPDRFVGMPRPMVTPGRPLEVAGIATEQLATGLGLNKTIFNGDLGTVLSNVQKAKVPRVDLEIGGINKLDMRENLEAILNAQRIDLVSNALATKFINDPVTGPAFPITEITHKVAITDTLDRILAQIMKDTSEEEA